MGSGSGPLCYRRCTSFSSNHLLALVFALAACGGEAADPCPAGAPDLSTCSVHGRFADCGGAGEPRLGCSETQGCLWFSEGCVAAGFTASDCPADDICCHSNWPFDEYSSTNQSYLYQQFYASGLMPWDETTFAVVAVGMDPSLTGATGMVSCAGPDFSLGTTNPCTSDGSEFDFKVDLGSAHFEVIGTRGLRAGWYPWVEVFEDEATSVLTARACAFAFTDLLKTECPPREAICASSGTVTFNRWPTSSADVDGLVVELDVLFDAGLHLQAVLVK